MILEETVDNIIITFSKYGYEIRKYNSSNGLVILDFYYDKFIIGFPIIFDEHGATVYGESFLHTDPLIEYIIKLLLWYGHE